MIDLRIKHTDYAPEGTCDLAGHYANSRHYCENAATCEVEIGGNGYRACDACLLDIVKAGVLERAA